MSDICDFRSPCTLSRQFPSGIRTKTSRGRTEKPCSSCSAEDVQRCMPQAQQQAYGFKANASRPSPAARLYITKETLKHRLYGKEHMRPQAGGNAKNEIKD